MDWSVVIAFAAALVAALLGVLVGASRGSPTRWVFCAGMLLLAADSALGGLSRGALDPHEVAWWEQGRLLIASVAPGAWLLFSIRYARENARELTRQTRWLWIPALLVPSAAALIFRERLVAAVAAAGPGAPWVVMLGPAGVWLSIWGLLAAILVLMNLERTYRAAVGTMRWRIKFMVLGVGALFVLRGFTASQGLIFRALDLNLQGLNSIGLLIASALVARTLVRTGHFEVGVYASRSILHGSFTVLLAGAYMIILGAAAKLTERLGGESAFELKAFLTLLGLVGLAVLLLSDHVRLKTRHFISRHFQRPFHDYRSVWRTFTERTSRSLTQKELCGSIAQIIAEIFDALSVGIWLVDSQKDRMALEASTSLTLSKGERPVIEGADAAAVLRNLADKHEPIDLDSAKSDWAAVLRRSNPSQFERGGNRLCVPIGAGQELLGCIIIADRVAGMAWSGQDIELLQAIGDQSAASLSNLQLTGRLAQSKQLEAFQAMSAFFVHDLKNTASTLALMLKNFPAHYQNAAFREDALRGMSRTVSHLNELVGRLNMLRHELEISAEECDLNQLVTDTLRDCSVEGGELVKELHPLPKVRVDAGQIRKVLTNLVLNAREAIGKDGHIRIETARHNGWVVLSVADDGCGMTTEFLRESLFRPFQSTKKDGLGIGMFHCKTIVEAHHGKIEVESAPGKGTTFRILLPTTFDRVAVARR